MRSPRIHLRTESMSVSASYSVASSISMLRIAAGRTFISLSSDNQTSNNMTHEMIAGIVLCVMGACLVFISPVKIWSVTDKWKTRGGEGPSRAFRIVTCLLGIIMIVAGCGLLIFG